MAKNLPVIPLPVPVSLRPGSCALLVLDISNTICSPRKSCVATLPTISSLLKLSRQKDVFVVYTTTPTPNTVILDEVKSQPGEPIISGRADKFFKTNLEEILKNKGIDQLILVGCAANGAVLYTAFEANLRGFTVAVVTDAVSTDDEFALFSSQYQLLNQPGFSNPDNKPLEKNKVCLTTTELINYEDK